MAKGGVGVVVAQGAVEGRHGGGESGAGHAAVLVGALGVGGGGMEARQRDPRRSVAPRHGEARCGGLLAGLPQVRPIAALGVEEGVLVGEGGAAGAAQVLAAGAVGELGQRPGHARGAVREAGERPRSEVLPRGP